MCTIPRIDAIILLTVRQTAQVLLTEILVQLLEKIMLQQIASILGIENAENNSSALSYLNRVASKISQGIDSHHPALVAVVEKAVDDVDREAAAAFSSIVSVAVAEPQEKTLKIKSSPKGSRIKVAAVNGVRFSFGPVWNESVKKAKGIAVVPTNRSKLDHQAMMLGISSPESMSAQEVCRAIAGKL